MLDKVFSVTTIKIYDKKPHQGRKLIYKIQKQAENKSGKCR